MAKNQKKSKTTKKSSEKTNSRKSTKSPKPRKPWAIFRPKDYVSEEVWNAIAGLVFLFLAIFFVAAAFGKGAMVGDWLFGSISWFMGIGYYLFPLLFLVLTIAYFRNIHDYDLTGVKLFGTVLFVLSGLGAIELVFGRGGFLGNFLALTENYIGFWMALLAMVVVFVISVVLIFDAIPFVGKIKEVFESDGEEKEKTKTRDLSEGEKERIEKVTDKIEEKTEKPEKAEESPVKPVLAGLLEKDKKPKEDGMEQSLNKKLKETFLGTEAKVGIPPLKLLSKDKGRPDVGDIKANANIIKRTFANFGISVEMDEVEVGPTVTRYAFKPAEGVKLSRIAGLQDDLALALAAKALRMETPIPGKSLVGIEIPNKSSTMVGPGTLLADRQYAESPHALPLALGKTIDGNATYIDLARAPHMLIAGATGAGKSATLHVLVNSLLYKHGPDMLKFIMVDPKRVEMTLYNGIPHLLTPVITDAKSAILALKWAVKEMNRRYDVLQERAVRDILSYHENIVKPYKSPVSSEEEDPDKPEAMPYIVVIIDELADIMQAYPRELEAGIVQLAQMSRAVGIHLILSTQRPSVNVITGLIKANVPTRIALQVASSVDSRTILDMGGAEKLLGKGDMLYMTGQMSKPVRAQSAFMPEEEVKSVVAWIKKHYRGELPDEIDLTTQAVSDNVLFAGSVGDDDDAEDDLYEDAKVAVIEAGRASTSYIQRKLRVGYSRAARLMDLLEEKGVIGPADGAKPREILLGQESQETGDLDDETRDETSLNAEEKHEN